MTTAVLGIESKTVLRFSRWDALLIGLAAVHGLALAVWPVIPVIAIGIWFNSNTIAHNFIHRPFFRRPLFNLIFSCYLSVLLGIPQLLWCDRHFAHHAGIKWRLRVSARLAIETSLVLSLWTTLAALSPGFFLRAYVPGYFIGLGLCALQGYYEHARGATSHYGWLYNALCFNDGYHVEHHGNPGIHWTRLPERLEPGAHTSGWPALVRWLDSFSLETLEKLVLRSPALQRFVLESHLRAFCALMPQLPQIRRAVVVGGGLFPRTALILQKVLPSAQIVVVDASSENLAIARSLIVGNVEFVNQRYVPGEFGDCDLLVIPLAFKGDRAAVYEHPPSRAVLIHDWMWRRRGTGRVVSAALLKRMNLVLQ
jgi:hypothetical protein